MTKLEITREWLEAWAATYPIEDDAGMSRLAGKVRPSYSDIEAIIKWKSNRSVGYFHRNERGDVRAVVRASLDLGDESAALKGLMSLHGVGEKVRRGSRSRSVAHARARNSPRLWFWDSASRG